MDCVWKDVHCCEQEIFSSQKDHFMADIGYSGTSLVKKLGIKPEMKILVMYKPEDYFKWLGADISQQFAVNETPDLVRLFATNLAILKKKWYPL